MRFIAKLLRRKVLDTSPSLLHRTLGFFSLTALGVGATLGAGVCASSSSSSSSRRAPPRAHRAAPPRRRAHGRRRQDGRPRDRALVSHQRRRVHPLGALLRRVRLARAARGQRVRVRVSGAARARLRASAPCRTPRTPDTHPTTTQPQCPAQVRHRRRAARVDDGLAACVGPPRACARARIRANQPHPHAPSQQSCSSTSSARRRSRGRGRVTSTRSRGSGCRRGWRRRWAGGTRPGSRRTRT